MKGDLLKLHKSMRGSDRVNAQIILAREGESRAREHKFEVRCKRFNRNLRHNFLTQRWWLYQSIQSILFV